MLYAIARLFGIEDAVRRRLLASLLKDIQANDTNYGKRYGLVLNAVSMAHNCGYAAGFRVDPKDPSWPVAFIELPGGLQVSWHMPQHPFPWDGHTTEQKYKRIELFCEAVEAIGARRAKR